MKIAKVIVSILSIAVIAGGLYSTLQKEAEQYEAIDAYAVYRIKQLGPNFCGEELPLTQSDVNAKYQKQLDIYTYHRRSTEILLKRANRWFPTIEKILAENGLPEDFKYLALVESNLTNVTSRRGAGGFWQFVPRTGRYFGLRVDQEIDERLNPVASTEAACKYFWKSKEGLNSNWTNVAASYNMGVYGMKKKIKQQGTDDYYRLRLNKETTGYLYKIAVLKEIYENQSEYGFDCHKPVKVYDNEIVDTEATESIQDLESFAYNRGLKLSQLKKLNPWLKGNSVTLNKNQAMRLVLPAGRVNPMPRNNKMDNLVKTTRNFILAEELAYNY